MFLDPDEILGRLGVMSGSKVGDFGTGSGTYALKVAKQLGPEATVYAFDAYHPLVDSVGRLGRTTGANFYAIKADLNQHIPLKDNVLHAAIAVNILHALEARQKFVAELSRVIQPGGRVLVVDWVDSFKNMGPTPEQAIQPGEAARLFEDAGFELGSMLPAGTHHFAFIATLPKIES